MKCKIIILAFILFLLVAQPALALNRWEHDTFGGQVDVSVSANTRWEHDTFGGSVEVYDVLARWEHDTFGGNVTVQAMGFTGWSDWWNHTRLDYSAPTGFTVSNYDSQAINLSWTSNPSADSTVIRAKKGSLPVDHTDGTEIYNSTASLFDHTSLDAGTHYFYKAWSFNSSLGLSSNNVTGDDWTSPANPSNFANNTITNTSVGFTWTNGANATNAVIRYQTGSYPANPQSGSEGYNSSGASTTVSPLSVDTVYYFRIWNYANGYFSDSYQEMIVETLADVVPPSNFNASTYSSSRIDLTWTPHSTADTTYIMRKKGSIPVDRADGTNIYNGSGNSFSDNFLDTGTLYCYKAWSYNSSLGFSVDDVNDTAYTRCGIPSNFVVSGYSRNYVSFTWTKGLNATRSVIRYKTGSYPANPQDGSNGYNDTGNSGTVYGLSANTTYYFRIWGYVNPFSESYQQISQQTLPASTPDPPYNASINYIAGGYINITWNRGNFSDEDVIVRKSSGYPATWDDGTVLDRTNNSTGTPPDLLYYYNESGIDQAWYYSIFSYNMTNSSYSNPCYVPQYSALGLNCFNESNPSQAINFNILISDKNGTNTFYATDLSNTYWIDVASIPYGEDTVFVVTNSSYKQRTYYYDIDLGNFYNYSFYLPPLETNDGSGGGGGGDTGTLRPFTNVVSVTNPALDATITLSHPLESIIEVSRYEIMYDQQTKTDSQSVSNPSVNVTIPLTKELHELIGVYIFNSSLYGGWITVPDDKYSLNETECEIDDSVMDDNTTIARIDYYYLVESYGQWITVPDDKYTASSTQVIVDASVLTQNTTMAKAEYYYMQYENETTATKLYILKVVNEYDIGIQDAEVDIKRYMTSTSGFESVSVVKTDANGQVEVYLIPNVLYKIFIEADQYKTLEVSEWIPDPEFYGIYHPKTFRLMFKEGTYPDPEKLMDNITWSIEPEQFYWDSAFYVYFNISSSDNAIEWFNATLYHWNTTELEWDLLNTSNLTTPNGGSISFQVPNVTGRYAFSCTFKKQGFDAYTFGMSDGCRTYNVYWSLIEQQVSTIPEGAYLVITIIFTLLVMGFLVKFGAGANAGIAGLAVMGGMFALRPEMMVGVAGHEISVWLLFLATAITYIIVMFISRGK